MYIAHGPISYITNEIIQKKRISKLSTHEKSVVMILSILFGVLPDVDLAILSMTNTPVFLHHKVLTHSITFYLLIWIFLLLFFQILKKILNKEGRKTFNENLFTVVHYSFLIGTLSHLFADSLFSSLRLFYPLKTEINILGRVLEKNYFASFLYSPSFAIEILSILIFLMLLIKRYIKNFKYVKYFLYTLIILAISYFGFTVYTNQNTYNMPPIVKNGEEQLDIDFDGVQDIYDIDTNNDGVINIYEYDNIKGKEFVESISNKTYLTTTLKNRWESIKFKYGAFSSYRVVSQTYLEQNLSLEPVLLNYVRKRDKIQTYSLQYSYPTLIYEYAKENGYLTIPNYELDSGKVFFILQNDKLVNMGILIDETNFVVVLEGDRRLVRHTKDEIESTYPNLIIKVLNTH
ncbi:metal-dependent hydrolase [Candidatus Dojkabacteria bacterium]|uniref:Metal-dependent hydrolase n=1 Tax=Candidatus Dojkabacteria bacterium TaxID=2099670 RepID=A0A847ETV3_9BACT|nr:metal-dependent hydrolase [Candidatus Dojkabacteria bacterium]